MKYYVVRSKTGEVFKKNGMFGGDSVTREYPVLSAAKRAAIAIAKYRHYRGEKFRVDNEAGETLFETDGSDADA